MTPPKDRHPAERALAVVVLTLAGALLTLALLAGCATAPDTLCRIARPRAALNDTPATIASQADAAKIWDRHCTVAGWIRG